MTAPRDQGLVLRIGPRGTLLEVLVDSFGVTGGLDERASLSDLIAASNLAKLNAFLGAARHQGFAFDWEMRLRHHVLDAPRTLYFVAMRLDGGELVVGGHPSRELDHVLDEMTHLHNEMATTHRELARAHRELSQAHARRNELLGVVSHDLRNPLSTIRMATELILRDRKTVLDERHRIHVERIARQTRFMAELIDDLLDVSATEAGSTPLDSHHLVLDDFLAELLDNHRATATDKSIALELENKALETVRIEGDHAQLRRVVDNLVSNAIKFSPRDTRVTVGLEAHGHWAFISVADQGPGLLPDEVETIFEPFARASAQPTGGESSTGLGLSIARRIVEAHHGHLSVSSEPGQGAVFMVRLPRLG